ncbi:V-type ATPase subunit [Candidatus Poribacteria bacterium]|nr:V-type ATPase subunit [Candidatus Poribacteria bacterium]
MFPTCRELHKEDARYGFSTGRIRMLENRLLDRITLERMIDAPDVGSAIHIMGNKYGHLSINVDTLKNSSDFEEILSGELYKFYLLAGELSPDNELLNIFLYKYTFHNFKVLLKSKYVEEGMDMIFFNVGAIPFMELRDLVLNHHKDHPIIKIREDVESKFLAASRNSQVIDLALDQEYFKWIRNIALELKLPVITELVKIWIDLANIKNLFRCLFLGRETDFMHDLIYPGGHISHEEYINFYIHKNWDKLNEVFVRTPYGALIHLGIESLKINSLAHLERKLDDFPLQWMQDSKYVVFGVEPLINYILRKEYEQRLLRVIVISKIYHISSEGIRKQLGEIF